MRSIRFWIIPAALALLAGGCTYDELRRDTSNVETTMADLRYQGVMNNLAMMVHNPASLPNPVAVSTGYVQVSDSGTANGNTVFNPHGLMTWQVGVGGLGRQITEQWALQPLHKPDKLRMMRCAFQVMMDAPITQCSDPACGPDCNQRLHEFLSNEDKTEDLHCAIPRGWYSVGHKCDVPLHACYIAHYCDTYVWVMPDGIDGLSRFTMTMLRIALTDQSTPAVSVNREFGPDGKVTKYTIQSVEVLPVVPGEVKPIRQTIDVSPAPGTGVISPPVLH